MYQAGYFDNENKEYVITNMKPIRPLINYLWSENVVCICDQFGFGSSFAGIGTIKRYIEGKERLVYIKDKQNGNFYSPNRNYRNLPFDKYECHVGLGYQKIISSYNGISFELTISVPVNDYVELFQIKVKNNSGIDKELGIYFYLKPEANLTWHTSYGTGDYNKKLAGLFFPHFGFNLEHEYNCLFLKADKLLTAFDTTDINFKGIYNSLDNPIGLQGDKLSCKGTTFEDEYAAVMQFDISLKAGEEYAVHFVTGTEKSLEGACRLAEKYASKTAFESNLQQQIELNGKYTHTYYVDTPDGYLNIMANIWLKRQLSLGKTWGRIGGKGFRDVMQDIAAFVSFDPLLAKTRILYALKHQYYNGNTIRMYEPEFTHPYYDGAAWIPATVIAYIKETGDMNIIHELVGYLDNDIKESVFEHIYKGLRFLLDNKGIHGLTLWGGGDWNDSLNNVGMQGKGESVWLSIATVKAVNEFVELLEYMGGKERLVDVLKAENKQLKENIKKYGWDFEYFIYGINDWGEKVGSAQCEEGKLYLNAQTWAVLAEILDKEQSNKLMDIVEKRLKCPYGYLQLIPSYKKGTDHLGRASYFVPGMVENGSVYNHGVAFKIAADCKLGRGNAAYNTFKMISYDNPENQLSGVEPYAVSNMYIGPENPYKAGKAPMSWVTGTAGWLYRCITEYMLGVSAEFNGLKLKPCLPEKWDNIKIKRKFRGAEYIIEYIRRADKEKILFDGKEIDGNIIPVSEKGSAHTIKYYFN